MLKQLIVTLLVALAVVVFARMKRGRTSADASDSEPTVQNSRLSASPTVIAGYVLAALMILATAGITWTRYQAANEIVRVEVVDTRTGDRTIYQVRRKQLGEREFTTVNGRIVSLGASDRMERIE